MKVKVTEKQIKENYYKIISIGYCNAQYLLKDMEPRYYTCGVNGWKADIYHIENNLAIATGYAPFGNIKDYDLMKKYEDKARKIWNNYDLKYEQRAKKVEKLRSKYIKELLERKGE